MTLERSFAAFLLGVPAAMAGTTDDGVPDSRYIEYAKAFAPYTAKISGLGSDGRRSEATATLLDPHWAITAAHVVHGWDERHNPPKHVVAFAQNQVGEVRVNEDVMGTVNTNQNASGRNTPRVQSAMHVRRLTPTECCRLQGFPDDHCDITFRKKPAADGPKYRALGNSMAVPCMVWIAHRIHEATK